MRTKRNLQGSQVAKAPLQNVCIGAPENVCFRYDLDMFGWGYQTFVKRAADSQSTRGGKTATTGT